ncbi:MAG: hypothetical protein LBH10_01100 [Burkholderiaceae bacterium]|jgi:hypothetical protein|nr:hypothetical protein [Burkholderiaceae bacterium]
MSAMLLQRLIVFVIVIAAALYALWRWLPRAWRRGAARRLTTRAQNAGLIGARRASRISAALGRPAGCAACAQRAGCQSRQPATDRQPSQR